MRDQVLNLLAIGTPQEDVLRIVGCSPDYIGELLKDKEFLQDLRIKREGNRQELIEQNYAKMEQAAQIAITKEVNSGMVDVVSMCRILETAAKNRLLYRQPNNHYQNPTVSLTIELKLPQGAERAGVTIDQKSGQILAIGDRDMTAMPILGVQNIFKDMEKEQKDAIAAADAVQLDKVLRGSRVERTIIDEDLEITHEQATDARTERAA